MGTFDRLAESMKGFRVECPVCEWSMDFDKYIREYAYGGKLDLVCKCSLEPGDKCRSKKGLKVKYKDKKIA